MLLGIERAFGKYLMTEEVSKYNKEIDEMNEHSPKSVALPSAFQPGTALWPLVA